jgi:hypothetical protein
MSISYELAEYLSLKRTIGAPVTKVWPVFLDMNRWYTDYHWDWISGPPYQGVGLQEGQVLKATPLYGVGMLDPTLYYLQEQVKVTPLKSAMSSPSITGTLWGRGTRRESEFVRTAT